MAEFKDRLRELRHEKGITQNELGEVLGTGWTHVSMLETGKSSPLLSELVVLYKFFGVTIAYLIGESDIRN